jgi:hypothetical protein
VDRAEQNFFEGNPTSKKFRPHSNITQDTKTDTAVQTFLWDCIDAISWKNIGRHSEGNTTINKILTFSLVSQFNSFKIVESRKILLDINVTAQDIFSVLLVVRPVTYFQRFMEPEVNHSVDKRWSSLAVYIITPYF